MGGSNKRKWEKEDCFPVKRLGLDGRFFSFLILSERWGPLPPPSRRSTALIALKNIYLVGGGGYTYAVVFVWKSEDNVWESVLSFYHWTPGIKVRTSGLAANPQPRESSQRSFVALFHPFTSFPGLFAHQLVTCYYCYYWFESHLSHLPAPVLGHISYSLCASGSNV